MNRDRTKIVKNNFFFQNFDEEEVFNSKGLFDDWVVLSCKSKTWKYLYNNIGRIQWTSMKYLVSIYTKKNPSIISFNSQLYLIRCFWFLSIPITKLSKNVLVLNVKFKCLHTSYVCWIVVWKMFHTKTKLIFLWLTLWIICMK